MPGKTQRDEIDTSSGAEPLQFSAPGDVSGREAVETRSRAGREQVENSKSGSAPTVRGKGRQAMEKEYSDEYIREIREALEAMYERIRDESV